MAERGATPQVPALRRRALRAVRSLFSPLLPDDYLELINPLWSTRELRGRIERIEVETAEAATVMIRPGFEWTGHRPGQYLRIGVVVDGVHHWRAYSLTSDPGRADGCISITPKLVEAGEVSPYLVRDARPGEIVRLGGVEGTFVLPDPAPEKLLFISAGSGVTPIMSMLSSLDRDDAVGDVVHIHSARTADSVIFGERLRALGAAHEGYRPAAPPHRRAGPALPRRPRPALPRLARAPRLRLGAGGDARRADPALGGEGDPELLELERFQPTIGGEPGGGEGGPIRFSKSRVEAGCDGATPILAAGEDAGAILPFGCRMGICHTCVGELRSGRVRDLRTGKVHGSEGEMVRTCVNAPEGPIEIAL